MSVQSINQITQNNKTYSSRPNKKVDYNFNQTRQVKYEFSLSNNFNKEISFGASVEEYAQRFLNSVNFEDVLDTALRKEVPLAEKIGRFLNFDYENSIRRKYNDVINRINELRKEIAESNRKKQSYSDYIYTQESKVDTKIETSINNQKDLEKQIKLEEINTKKNEIKLDRKRLDAEEESLKFEKEIVQEQKFSDYTSVLKNKFIKLVRLEKGESKENLDLKNLSKITVPNGIMLTGLDKNTTNWLTEWMVKKSDCNFKKIDFTNLTDNDALKELVNTAQESKTTGKRTLIQIENFDKIAIPTGNNGSLIAKFKAFLESCSEKYKCTVITNVKDPSELAPEITGVQRFPVKIKLDE